MYPPESLWEVEDSICEGMVGEKHVVCPSLEYRSAQNILWGCSSRQVRGEVAHAITEHESTAVAVDVSRRDRKENSSVVSAMTSNPNAKLVSVRGSANGRFHSVKALFLRAKVL